jgi:hypothetical protein
MAYTVFLDILDEWYFSNVMQGLISHIPGRICDHSQYFGHEPNMAETPSNPIISGRGLLYYTPECRGFENR